MSNAYARVVDGKIVDLLMADDEYIKNQEYPSQFILAESVQGSRTIGSAYCEDDGLFYLPQPHEMWIRDGNGDWRPPLEKPNPWQHLTVSGHFGTTAEQIHELPNLIPDSEVDQILNFAKSIPNENWSVDATSYTVVLFADDIKTMSSAVFETLENIANTAASSVEQIFNVKVGTPRVAITKMSTGAFQVPHPDKHLNTWGYMEEYPPDNDLTAVVYYNEDFEGGELFFPQHELEISPKKGLVVTYPGDTDHIHGVREVTAGFRYTSPIFFPIKEIL